MPPNFYCRKLTLQCFCSLPQLVVVYAVDAGHQEAADMAKKLGSSLTLSAEHRAKLTSVLGIDIIADLKEKEIFES